MSKKLIIRGADFSKSAITYCAFVPLIDNKWNNLTPELTISEGWMSSSKVIPNLGKIIIFDENGKPNNRPLQLLSYDKLDNGVVIDNKIITSTASINSSAKYFVLQAIYEEIIDSQLQPFSIENFEKYKIKVIGAERKIDLKNPNVWVKGRVYENRLQVGSYVSPSSLLNKFLITYPTLDAAEFNGVTLIPKNGTEIRICYSSVPSPSIKDDSELYSCSNSYTTPITIGGEDIQADYLIIEIMNVNGLNSENISDYVTII